MARDWVDFKAVKEAVSMLALLEHYGIAGTLKKRGEELRGKCPLHDGDGKESFHASLTKNAFQCFSCKAKGNVLDFVAAKEKCNVREAAVKLAEWFKVGNASAEQGSSVPKSEQEEPKPVPEKEQDDGEDNKPLGFELQGIQFDHPYLKARGIDEEIARHFGAGFFPGKGLMAGRVVIPIYDHDCALVAYAGRAIDGSEPKYKFPAGFKKSRVVFGLAALSATADSVVVVVEGFFDAIRLTQAGFAAVALMGSTMSKRQAELLGEQFEDMDVVLMLDGDEAGRRGMLEAVALLAKQPVWIRCVWLNDGQQPDSMSGEEVARALDFVP